MNFSILNTTRSVSPTPRSATSVSIRKIDFKRHLSKEEKLTLSTMTIDEKDADLLKEFFEIHYGNFKVSVAYLKHINELKIRDWRRRQKR